MTVIRQAASRRPCAAFKPAEAGADHDHVRHVRQGRVGPAFEGREPAGQLLLQDRIGGEGSRPAQGDQPEQEESVEPVDILQRILAHEARAEQGQRRDQRRQSGRQPQGQPRADQAQHRLQERAPHQDRHEPQARQPQTQPELVQRTAIAGERGIPPAQRLDQRQRRGGQAGSQQPIQGKRPRAHDRVPAEQRRPVQIQIQRQVLEMNDQGQDQQWDSRQSGGQSEGQQHRPDDLDGDAQRGRRRRVQPGHRIFVGGERQRVVPVGQLEHAGHPEELRQPQPDRQIQEGIERDFGDAQCFIRALEEGRDDVGPAVPDGGDGSGQHDSVTSLSAWQGRQDRLSRQS